MQGYQKGSSALPPTCTMEIMLRRCTSEASKHNNRESAITALPEDKLQCVVTQVEYLCTPVPHPLYSIWNYSIISCYSLSPHFLPHKVNTSYPPSLNLYNVVESTSPPVNQPSFNCENLISYESYIICCTYRIF